MDIRRFHAYLVQNFHLVWLDGSIDEIKNEDCRNTITQLRQVVNTVNIFTDVDECIDFITDNTEEKAFVISSGALGQTTATVVHDIAQVRAMYIFCGDKIRYEQLVTQWPKVKGVFTDITSICEALKQAAQETDQNSISLSFVASTSGGTTQSLDQLDSTFMYTQILKEILFTIDFEPKHFVGFISYCREQLGGNSDQLNNIGKLEREYRDHVPIWWYTYPCFLYSMLNRALRTMEIDLIIKMGFFVRDLHEHIIQLHSEKYVRHGHSAPFTVFRGQGVCQQDFNQLKKTEGGLMSFNNFLSTSVDRAVSLAFAESNQGDPDLIGVLFQITTDPSISSTPFADIRDVSYYQGEEEILFSMHSIFRIGQIKQLDNSSRLWEVDLTLTDDNDPQLHDVTNSIREETTGYTGWGRLGHLMIKVGQFNQAEELYEILLDQTTDQVEIGLIYDQLGLIKDKQGKYTEAVTFYEKSLEIYQTTLPANHPNLGGSYNNIGLVYDKMGGYSKALSYHAKALKIAKNTVPANHPLLATSNNNIGAVYRGMGEYSKALSYYAKALEIYQKALPPTHPSLATSYDNIGSMYDKMGGYSKALSYYEKALEIRQKSLPINHPDFGQSYNNIGGVYREMGEYSKALSYYEKALEIAKNTLPENHPFLATFYNNIGLVYREMGEYSKALSYYEKSLEIRQKTLPENHPFLATFYNNIGSMYDKMGGYSKALSYYEKALEIRQKSLPINHPDFGQSYNNIGGVYREMGQYSKALSYYEKALEIAKNTLPENHPFLATFYNNIGLVYREMGEYSKALSYYEKSLEIRQKTLPANHPDFGQSYSNIGCVYVIMGDYLKALSFFERDVDILQRSLPANHPDLLAARRNIELIKMIFCSKENK